ncbi:hypothetical protein Q5752_006756 [Cryptotrichosporon argae]
MAVVLRSSSDLIYLPDHGYDGVQGALKILPQITPRHHRLDVAHNLLGDEGIATLARGLAAVRAGFSRLSASPGAGVWSMRELSLGSTGCGDAGLASVLAYARKDAGLVKVLVQANAIEMADNAEAIAVALDASHIHEFSLNNNALSPTAVPLFFGALHAPALRSLHMSACAINSSSAGAIAAFLCSPRARALDTLELNGNQLGLAGVRAIVDAVELGNFSLVRLGLLANDEIPAIDSDDAPDPDADLGAAADLASRRAAEQRAIADEVGYRLPPLLERNAGLTARVRRAALRALPAARILLAARAPGNAEQAVRAIRAVEAAAAASHPPAAHFRLLDLPREIQWLVARHAAADPYALSEAQWARLRGHAEDRDTLARAVRAARERRVRAGSVDEWKLSEREARDEWLRRGGWDKWEAERRDG